MPLRRVALALVCLILAGPAVAGDPPDLSATVEPILEKLRAGTQQDWMAAALTVRFLPEPMKTALRETGSSLMLDGLRSENEITRGLAAEMLGEVKAAEARPSLAKATEDPSDYVRTFAIRALWEVSGGEEKPVLPHVVRLLADPDWVVRRTAIDIAGEMKSSAADLAGPVGEALVAEDRKLEREKPDEVFRVRRSALDALAGMGAKAAPARAALAATLGSAFVELRTKAARALGGIGAAARAEEGALVDALEDEIPEVRREVAAALVAIGGVERSTARALRDALDDGDEEFVLLAVAAIGAMGEHGASAVPALRGVVRDGDRNRRLAAVRALGEIGPAAKTAAAVLEKVAEKDPDAAVREAAATALARIRPEK